MPGMCGAATFKSVLLIPSDSEEFLAVTLDKYLKTPEDEIEIELAK